MYAAEGGAKFFGAKAIPTCGKLKLADGKVDFTLPKGVSELGKSVLKLGKFGSDFGKFESESGKSDLDFGKFESESGKSDLDFGKFGSESGKSGSDFDKSDLDFDKSESESGKSNFAIGKAFLAYGACGFSRGSVRSVGDMIAAIVYPQFFEGGTTMSKTTDWLPGDRKSQITMTKNWLTILNEETEGPEGALVKKYEAWGIPKASIVELGLCLAEAEACLDAAENEETRTKPVNAACVAAFENLEKAARNLKRRHFFMPPLSGADYAALGFRQPDKTHSVTGEPTAQIVPELFLTTDRHELGVIARYVKGSPDDKANKAYFYWYKVVAPGETPPASPDELPKLFSTLRKKDVIPFEYGDSGKTVYMAARVDNNGKKGPWGPMVSAVIP